MTQIGKRRKVRATIHSARRGPFFWLQSEEEREEKREGGFGLQWAKAKGEKKKKKVSS